LLFSRTVDSTFGGKIMKTGFTKYALSAALAICVATASSAAPVVLTTNFNVWHGTNPNPGDPTNLSQRALPTNTLSSQDYIGFFSYTGAFNFSDTNQATDTMSNFISGVGLPNIQMSSPNFTVATLFEFTFVLTSDLIGASITHDDGVSLYDLTTNSDNLIPGNDGPTVAATTALPTLLAGHNYELWYVAANGAPSILSLDGPSAVPELSSWAMFIVGFGAIGFAARKGRRTSVNGVAI
jgi:hypothetical protein